MQLKASEKLLMAAGVLSVTGMNSFIRYDSSNGTRCALGGLDKVALLEAGETADEVSGGFCTDDTYTDVVSALAARLIEMGVPEASKHSKYPPALVAQWSNRLVGSCKSKEVIALFQEVGRDLARVGL